MQEDLKVKANILLMQNSVLKSTTNVFFHSLRRISKSLSSNLFELALTFPREHFDKLRIFGLIIQQGCTFCQ